jgi:hypothetical protein
VCTAVIPVLNKKSILFLKTTTKNLSKFRDKKSYVNIFYPRERERELTGAQKGIITIHKG